MSLLGNAGDGTEAPMRFGLMLSIGITDARKTFGFMHAPNRTATKRTPSARAVTSTSDELNGLPA